jgi:hypothetical protein
MKRARWLVTGLIAVMSLAPGCGRVRPPWQPPGKPVDNRTVRRSTGPLPEQTTLEVGAAEAKVRIIAFFPMDEERKPVTDLLKSLAKEHPGKVYVKCTDLRTPEGQQARQDTGGSGPGLLINGQSDVTINAKPSPYTMVFNQDMGRFWTEEGLRAAVAQEVAKAYGK